MTATDYSSINISQGELENKTVNYDTRLYLPEVIEPEVQVIKKGQS